MTDVKFDLDPHKRCPDCKFVERCPDYQGFMAQISSIVQVRLQILKSRRERAIGTALGKKQIDEKKATEMLELPIKTVVFSPNYLEFLVVAMAQECPVGIFENQEKDEK